MDVNKQINNKRIVKNTFYLYFRMIIVMLLSLVTAKYTLNCLGVEDYGIYNVVAGIIQFTGIITATMIQATQRFLSFDLGKDDKVQFQNTFSMMMNIFIIICISLFFIMELIGPYCIVNFLNIPAHRLYAALWVFQFSIFNFILDTINIPHTASIVAYEKMNIYACFTFVDIVFKLIVIFSLFFLPYDKLIIYGFLNTFACFIRNEIVHIYCRRKLEGCIYHKYWNAQYFRILSSYIGWSLLGSTNSVMMGQGQSIILNLFFGPVINAAKAVADKVKSLIYSFISNFYMAVTPQIIKTYATGDIEYTKNLVISSSKYAFFLMQLLSLPIIFNTLYLLRLWLGHDFVSAEMVTFCQLTLLFGLVQVLECPITKAVQASSSIKKYEIVVGLITLSFIPLCYLLFRKGFPATSSMSLLTLIYVIAHIYRVYYVSPFLNLSIYGYFMAVIKPILLSTIVSYVLIRLFQYFVLEPNTLGRLLFQLIVDAVIVSGTIWAVGLKKQEQYFVKKIILKKLGKRYE